MDRKSFLKNGIKAGLLFGLASTGNKAQAQGSETEETSLENVGFEHLPNTESKIMNNMILHRANTRGNADHGWLKTNHTFSFSNYYNRERMHFGVLRVLNDDEIAGGTGFGTHPHDNMEIVSIPLEGGLEHRDSMGNHGVIRAGDVQVMSAGTGVQHSEYNHDKQGWGKFLQIWLFPKQRAVKPRYDQRSFGLEDRRNAWQNVVAPMDSQDPGLKIYQDAWFSLSHLEAGKRLSYKVKRKGNGLYIFLIQGSVKVAGQTLNKRDGLGVWDLESLDFEASAEAEILVMDVPMQLPRI